ncbi:MAG: Tab2/Atab2 family RNA-binding protein [Gloeomargarita sp. SKYG116]|nr:Tab2/Atab2 family RNA-binding protein [Gloeomargarita sp. SKYG116]MDW8400941.1 Tab2/Atab2 family RNA-binding protein [Gloeomargarita sp. SKYGB_i_bin116]
MARVVWEVDFYTRPVVDDQGKKLWELLLCDPQGKNQVAQTCPPDQVNSQWLRETLASPVQQHGITHLRSFRAPMLPMLQRACEPLQVTVLPSRRVVALAHWLQERWRHVYSQMPGFQPLATPPPPAGITAAPQPLPEALRGQKWAWATLLWGDIRREAHAWADFGELLPLQYIHLPDKTVIPGIVIYSQRATALAAWMSGLELAEVQVTGDQVVLLSGLDERWLFAARASGGPAFQTQQQQAQGVHFLAVQSHPEAERLAGFWLMQTLALW